MSPHLRLRTAVAADAAAIAAIYEPHVRDSAVSFETDPPTPQQISQRMTGAGDRYPWIVCKHGDLPGDAADVQSVVGYAYANRHALRAAFDWTVDVVIYVDERFHGRGVGRALYTTLFALLRCQGFVTAMAAVTSANAASARFHKSLGFALVGRFEKVGFKHGAWHGVNWYQLQLLAPSHAPSPVKPLSALPPTDLQTAFELGNHSLARTTST